MPSPSGLGVRHPCLVAVVAVLAVVGGATAARLLVTDDLAESAAAFGAPPDGTRWVGMDDVVVAVPDWWTTGETRCNAPVEDTVYFDEAATMECTDQDPTQAVREVSALAILDGSKGYGELVIRDMRPVAEVDGHEVVEAQACEEWFEGVCRRMFAVPSLGVVFAVTIDEPGDGDYEQIRDSLRILPDGRTTVPIAVDGGWTPIWGAEPDVTDDPVAELHAAGLEVELVTPEPREDGDIAMYADFPPGSFLGAEPSLGSVIDEGGTVTVHVMGRSAHRE